ncbi:MAG: C-terminal helicase domain-containing protein, partial [Mycoplasma sp.]|nr:C-terminal helicase domain-containing protein [Mycoplasma sp.]
NSIWLNNQISHNIIYQSNNFNPFDTLIEFLKNINPYFCIIFTNTKKEANIIYNKMLELEYNVGLIHQDIYERKRKQIYRQILNNKFQYLVATDLIARGIDIPHADIVISFGLPSDTMWYIHRAGRIGRNKRNGYSYCIYRITDDGLINNLIHKGIKWNFFLINNESKLIAKNKELKIRKKLKFDEQTNNQIKKIIYTNSKKVKPGYKKKIKQQIYKIKQKVRHQNIEKKIKRTLIHKNINESKR